MKKLVAIALGVALAGVGTVALASRNSSGTHTLPAGNPVVSGTSISTTWANNTLGDISQALTDSLDRNGKGGMLAPLRTPNGSVSAPTHSFTSDTDTGLYLVGDANPAMTVAGAKRQEWTATGTKVTGTIEITGSVVGDVAMSQAAAQSVTKSGGALKLVTADANEIQFFINNAQVAAFQTDGDLWLGAHKLQGVAEPGVSTDAATMGYVDTRVPTGGRIIAAGTVSGAGVVAAGSFGLGAVTHTASSGVYSIALSVTTTNPIAVVSRQQVGNGWAQASASGGVLTVSTWTPTGATDAGFSVIVMAGD